jgi:hypothetical protein
VFVRTTAGHKGIFFSFLVRIVAGYVKKILDMYGRCAYTNRYEY